MPTITFLGLARRRKPRSDIIIIIIIIIFDIIIYQVSIPNIADYYDSRISKKENDKTLVMPNVMMKMMVMMVVMMMMMMIMQVRLPWQMGIFSPRLSKRTPEGYDFSKNLGVKSSARDYFGGKSSGEEEEGLHHLGSRDLGAKI